MRAEREVRDLFWGGGCYFRFRNSAGLYAWLLGRGLLSFLGRATRGDGAYRERGKDVWMFSWVTFEDEVT